ncbi:pentapeptide repeat protein [Yimella lutea]|uniref:Pentapeptide repeat protein n=2 Tax=Yimella lutea TaxID=587872 RepID=A0A542EF02_9MICO|nr:pentapeptide repeat protein [Yimella lutea]
MPPSYGATHLPVGVRWEGCAMEIADRPLDRTELERILNQAREPVALVRCDLSGANLRDLDLTEVTFDECALDGALLDGAALGGVIFTGCRMTGVSMERTRGLGFEIRRSNLFAANLIGAVLANADLTGCRFTEAVLRSADLHASVFDGCDLTEADLHAANLSDADLRGARLGECDLDRLRALKGAILTPNQASDIVADLTGAQIVPIGD